MVVCNCLLTFYEWLRTTLHGTRGNRNITPSALPSFSRTSRTLCESDVKKLRQAIGHDSDADADLHNILSQKSKLGWCERHLNIENNNKAIKIAQKFHDNASKSKRANIIDTIDTIQELALKLTLDDNDRSKVEGFLNQAREEGSLLPIIKIYTSCQKITQHLNNYLAANTYHALKLYCTLLNCPTLARTQEYIDTFASVFFHPELDNYVVHQTTVYRGATLKDKKLVEKYKLEGTIITTTCLSTSTNSSVADMFGNNPFEDRISILCTYNINNTNRRTALNLRELSQHPEEDEILILPYVPFTITSLEKLDDGRKMKICFEECTD